jgi:hypothetical protein
MVSYLVQCDVLPCWMHMWPKLTHIWREMTQAFQDNSFLLRKFHGTVKLRAHRSRLLVRSDGISTMVSIVTEFEDIVFMSGRYSKKLYNRVRVVNNTTLTWATTWSGKKCATYRTSTLQFTRHHMHCMIAWSLCLTNNPSYMHQLMIINGTSSCKIHTSAGTLKFLVL